jgi:hypothetical protein
LRGIVLKRCGGISLRSDVEANDYDTPAAWKHVRETLSEAMVVAMRSRVSPAHQSRRHVIRFTGTTGIPA